MISPYDGRTEETRNKITEGKTSYYVNKVYKNKTYGWYWFVNSKGYYHILKPCKIKYDGQFSHYEIEDILLKANNTTSSKTYGCFKTREECIAEIEKDMIQDEPDYSLEILAMKNKKYSTLYVGFSGEKTFMININNDTKCGMEYEFNSKDDFSEEEIEKLANDILDGKFTNKTAC